MDVHQTRRANLRWLIENECEGVAANLARTLGIQATQLSRIFSENARYRRNVGARLARAIEQATSKRRGWMDEPHVAPEAFSPGASKTDQANAVVLTPFGDRMVPVLDYVQASEWTASPKPYPITERTEILWTRLPQLSERAFLGTYSSTKRIWVGGTLQSFVKERRAQGVKSATVNRTLAIVRRILNLAARMWRDEHALTWLETPPMIQLQDWEDRRPPYPLSWDEQALLFRRLPAYLAKMALFKVNTGTREQEVCGLRWDWEERVPELGTTLFVVPGINTKNKEDRLIVLNRTAGSVVDAQRSRDRTWVFPYEGRRLSRMYKGVAAGAA